VSAADDLRIDLAKTRDIISAARDMAAAGHVVDLSPMHAKVEHLCNGIATLPVDDAAALKPRLVDLIDELDKLQATMLDRRKELENALNEIDGRGRAASAATAYTKNKPR
jgi:hypothetical protein